MAGRRRAWAGLSVLATCVACGFGCGGADATDDAATAQSGQASIRTVFVLVMENHDWADIEGNKSAPYINDVLLPQASYALNYHQPAGLHPSEPNYIWMEAGDNLGITHDKDPDNDHLSTTEHLVTQLEAAGISWKSYQESISGKECPLDGSLVGTYAPRHNPMVFFDDVTDGNDEHSQHCIDHVRPYEELEGDLASGHVARYNFITPNLCHDMHGAVPCYLFHNLMKDGDKWLSREVPKILASSAYRHGGALFITWDEADKGDAPIGMIALSPYAKGGGYTNRLYYTHSSLLRSVQTIFGVGPFLRDAAKARDLSDLFVTFP